MSSEDDNYSEEDETETEEAIPPSPSSTPMSAPIPTEEKEAPGGIPEEGLHAKARVVPKEEGRYKCQYCGQSFSDPLAKGRHVMTAHKETVKQIRERRIQREEELTEEQIISQIRLRGPQALEEVLRRRLMELLDMPGIPEESKVFALREWDRDPTIRLDFRALYSMLYDAGIKQDKITRIVEKLNMIYQKFLPALYPQNPPYGSYGFGYPPTYPPAYSIQPAPLTGHGAQGSPPVPSVYPPQYPQYGERYPAPSLPPPPPPSYPPPYPPYPSITEDKVRNMIAEEQQKAVQKIIEELKEKEPRNEIELETVIGYTKDGEPIMGKVSGNPAIITGLLAMTRQEPGKKEDKEESEYERALAAQLQKLETKLEEAERRADEAEKKRLEDMIAKLKDETKETKDTFVKLLQDKDRQLSSLAQRTTAEGYKSDAMRFVDSTVSKVAGLVQDRKPLERLVDFLTSPVQAQKTSDIEEFKALKESGLVVEQ